MTEALHRTVFIPGPVGRLEALLWKTPLADPPLAAVICHPHPLYGGTMHNKVVFQVARTFDALGLPTLRFNFRGAGLSEGEHDRGRGEGDDVRAALDFLAGEYPGRPLLVAGFSFGSWVGLRAGCDDPRVTELVGLGLPVNDSNFSFLGECPKPRLFLQGERDQYGSREKLDALRASFPLDVAAATRTVFIPGADHFFAGKLAQVDAALTAWLIARHPRLAAHTAP